jgi:hypothetical protein
MKKIFLVSVLSFAAGVGSVHAYWWLQSIRFDAERMRDLDEDFAEAAEIFYTSEAAEVEYDAPDEDE